MKIGKNDKEKIKKLEEENKQLKSQYIKKMYESKLMNALKAVILKFEEKSISISLYEMEEASKYDIYVTDDIMSFNKRYQLIDKRNFFKEGKTNAR